MPALSLRAEKYDPPTPGFSMTPSQEWIELALPYQNVVVSYGKTGTLATFHITECDLEGSETVSTPLHHGKSKAGTVDELQWKDLFSPEFKSIDIHQENVTVLAGEKTRFCIYTLKPGEFKDTMEGKLPGKYINYVLIHKGKLFSITFKDTEDSFVLTYPSFLAAIRTLRFAPSAPKVSRKNG